MTAPVCVRLRELLEAERAAGARFAVAWPRCVEQALTVAAPWDRPEWWRRTLDGMRSTWRAAYLGDARVGGTLSILAEHEDREPLGGRCARNACRQPIPAGKKATALYCSEFCQREVNRERERGQGPRSIAA